jgi:hypothetical protein
MALFGGVSVRLCSAVYLVGVSVRCIYSAAFGVSLFGVQGRTKILVNL